jgi:hypothetical protein
MNKKPSKKFLKLERKIKTLYKAVSVKDRIGFIKNVKIVLGGRND